MIVHTFHTPDITVELHTTLTHEIPYASYFKTPKGGIRGFKYLSYGEVAELYIPGGAIVGQWKAERWAGQVKVLSIVTRAGVAVDQGESLWGPIEAGRALTYQVGGWVSIPEFDPTAPEKGAGIYFYTDRARAENLEPGLLLYASRKK